MPARVLFALGLCRVARRQCRRARVLPWLAIAAEDWLRTRREAAERSTAITTEEVLRRIGEERLQVTREIHDVVAHAMTSINFQAGVAAHLIDRDPSRRTTRCGRSSGPAATR